jgi:hypothetical protein
MDSTPANMVTGDFNGDGALDLAIRTGGGTLLGGTRLVSLLGDGAGGFQTGAPVNVGNGVSFLAPANPDNDARDELVLYGSRIAGSSVTNFLEVFALNASGGWTNRQTLASTNFLESLQIVSKNGDAFPDLVVAETDSFTGNASLRMYPGGPAGFGPEQVLVDGVEFSSFNRLADLNGDGLLDVVAGNSVYLANPLGGFHPVQQIWITAEGVKDVTDFNGDGKADLLSGLSILLQR